MYSRKPPKRRVDRASQRRRIPAERKPSWDSGNLSIVTDPRGIATKSFYDALGRPTQVIQAYDPSIAGGNPTADHNQRTSYAYDGLDHQTLVIHSVPNATNPAVPGSTTTRYVYGVGTEDRSLLHNNDLLREIDYPNDKAGGVGGFKNYEAFAYDALGDKIFQQDRSGVQHTYTLDALGRTTVDAVNPGTIPGVASNGDTTGIALMDGTITSHTYGFDALGQMTAFATVSGTDGFIVTNDRREYNGFGQLTDDYQNGGLVHYDYQLVGNSTRLKDMVYPNGRVLSYGYDGSTLDNAISRVDYLADGPTTASGHLEEYSYLGLNTVVSCNRPEIGVELSYVQQAGDANVPRTPAGEMRNDGGDEYTGLDRFGRIVDQNWFTTNSVSTTEDRHQYAYDADSNVLYSQNLTPNQGANSELYQANGATAADAYDALNRPIWFERGTLGTTTGATRGNLILSPPQSQSWAVDPTGTFRRHDTASGGAWTDPASQRPIFQGIFSASSVASQITNGASQALAVAFDAWGNLRVVKNVTASTLTSNATEDVHSDFYDALGRRNVDNNTNLYYDAAGNVIEEDGEGGTTQYVWSPVGQSQLVLRDRDADHNTDTGYYGASGAGMEERLYALQDSQGNVTTLVKAAVDGDGDLTRQVVERYLYTPDGQVKVIGASADAPDHSAYDFQYLFHAGRYDGHGLTYSHGVEQDQLTGMPLQEDPLSYLAQQSRNYDPQISSGWGTVATAIKMGSWVVPIIGLSVNTAGDIWDRHLQNQGWASSIVGGQGDASGLTSVGKGLFNRDIGTWEYQGLSAGQRVAFGLSGVFQMALIGKGASSANQLNFAGPLNCRLISAGTGAVAGTGIGAAIGGLEGYGQSGTRNGALAGMSQGALMGGAMGGVGGFLNPFVCFVAGTQVPIRVEDENGQNALPMINARHEGSSVATALGVRYITRAIEQLVRGGQVVARDQHDPRGPLKLCRIKRVYVRTAYHLQVLTVRDDAGREQTLRVTDEHPVAVQGRDFVAARLLELGDRLPEFVEHESVVIANVGEDHPEGVTVYNVEVEDAHTYFVRAAGSDAEPMWVHNAEGYATLRGIARQEAEAAFLSENGLSEVGPSSRRGGAGDGPRGGYATQAQLEQVRDEFLANNPDFDHVAGGRNANTGTLRTEEFIPGPDLENPQYLSVRPDLTFQHRITGQRVRVQTFTADGSGNMIPSEAEAYWLLRRTGDPAIAIPKT